MFIVLSTNRTSHHTIGISDPNEMRMRPMIRTMSKWFSSVVFSRILFIHFHICAFVGSPLLTIARIFVRFSLESRIRDHLNILWKPIHLNNHSQFALGTERNWWDRLPFHLCCPRVGLFHFVDCLRFRDTWRNDRNRTQASIHAPPSHLAWCGKVKSDAMPINIVTESISCPATTVAFASLRPESMRLPKVAWNCNHFAAVRTTTAHRPLHRNEWLLTLPQGHMLSNWCNAQSTSCESLTAQ